MTYEAMNYVRPTATHHGQGGGALASLGLHNHGSSVLDLLRHGLELSSREGHWGGGLVAGRQAGRQGGRQGSEGAARGSGAPPPLHALLFPPPLPLGWVAGRPALSSQQPGGPSCSGTCLPAAHTHCCCSDTCQPACLLPTLIAAARQLSPSTLPPLLLLLPGSHPQQQRPPPGLLLYRNGNGARAIPP